jgi:hypothetical protein
MFVESLSMSLKKRVGMVPAVLSVWVSPEDDTKRKLGVFLYTICCAGLTKVQVPFELRPLSSLVNSQQIPLYKRAYKSRWTSTPYHTVTLLSLVRRWE